MMVYDYFLLSISISEGRSNEQSLKIHLLFCSCFCSCSLISSSYFWSCFSVSIIFFNHSFWLFLNCSNYVIKIVNENKYNKFLKISLIYQNFSTKNPINWWNFRVLSFNSNSLVLFQLHGMYPAVNLYELQMSALYQ